MKPTFLLLAANLLGLLVAQGQQTDPPPEGGSWNPYLIQGIVDPAPMLPAEFNGTGQLIFDVGNTGSDPIVWVTGQEVVLTVSLSRGKPNVTEPEDPVAAITAIGGVGAASFSWEYFPASRTYRGTQKADLPGGWRESVTIDYRVVENSFSDQLFQNGFNVNLAPPAYTNPQPTDDDTVSSYTFVEAFDFSDAPLSYGSASHEVDFSKHPDSGIYTSYVYLGNAVDPETDMQHTSGADGDDTNQTADLAVDDEDGVVFPTMEAGTTVQIPVSITLQDYDEEQTSSIRLRAWVDWNQDGVFDSTGERIVSLNFTDYLIDDIGEVSFTGSRTYIVNVSVDIPADALGTYYTRFRIGSTIGPIGDAAYGEVEDHIFEVGKAATFSGFLLQNAALFGLDDNVPPGVPATDPLTGLPTAGASDPNGDDMAGLGDNVDGDVYNNLLEFALCFDPGSGAKVFPDGTPNQGFHLEPNGASLDAKFNQPTGVSGVTYQVETSTDGQIWAPLAGIIPTTVTGPVSGSTTVCYEGINTTNPGLLRLKVTAGSGAAETCAVTGPIGWQMATIADFCQTYADPLLEPCLITGTITQAAGQVLDLTQAAGTQNLASRLEAGKNYYLEVMSGDNVGHLFDIESFTADSVTLAVDSDLCALQAPYSTMTTVPATLTGDAFVIREHKTLENLFPIDDIDTVGTVEGFAYGTNATDAGVLLRYDRTDGSLQTYIASSTTIGGEAWVASGASDNILPPGEGIFVHNLLGEVAFPILQYGEVRTNQLAVPLKEGYNFVAPAHPVVFQSIDGGDSTSRLMNADATGGKFIFEGNGARSLADQIQFWQDDTAADAASIHLCYDMIFYLTSPTGFLPVVDQWSLGGPSSPTEEEAKGLFSPTRSAMYCIQNGDTLDYYIPSPISNTCE
jgi:hypothetical protein